MADITYIPIRQLHPHPDNPRKELGDLSELAASIKENGVYQNLTVIPGHYLSSREYISKCVDEGGDAAAAAAAWAPKVMWVGDDYTIIIGHRRAAAAQQAGLYELPCAIVEMDEREQIANEMAKKNGMKSQFLAKKDPEYKRVEQYRCSDIDFLSQLCHDAGLSLKCTDGKLVIFDQKEYEGKDSAWTVTKDDKSYIKWSHTLGQAGTQYASCRVSYVGPNGKPIEGIAYVKDYDAKSKTNQQLEVYAPVTSKTEAKELAAKKLRLHNKFERQVGFTYHGDPGKVAGLTFETKSFGPWDGKYIVKQAKHTVTGSGGYTTQVSGRHVLGGY